MNLPTKDQIDAAGRYALAIGGPIVTILGLQAKGFTLDDLKALITALGDTVSSLVTLAGVLAPIYALVRGYLKSSPTAQAVAVEKAGGVVITTPEIAAATPNSPNVLSSDDVKVVQKS